MARFRLRRGAAAAEIRRRRRRLMDGGHLRRRRRGDILRRSLTLATARAAALENAVQGRLLVLSGRQSGGREKRSGRRISGAVAVITVIVISPRERKQGMR